ncbi:MAG: gliding motility-associated C-terminal domain-containing protein [Candidatus Latescibacteria bacterium]|nr:gliding motility-associated C-terminal domain-containing protein [Candidatus Latescibacterota bacterium]
MTIYRFGGQDLPPPPEAGRPGVVLVQREWADLENSAGGEALRLQMDEQGLGVLEYRPGDNVNIAPSQGFAPQLQPLYDRKTDTVWIAGKYLCGDRATLDCDGEYGPQGTIDIALEEPVFVERIRIFSNAGAVVRDLGVHLSAERFASGSGKVLRRPFAAEVRGNELPVLDIQLSSQQRSAALQVALGQHEQAWEIGEIQIYARGAVHTASYVSNIIDFGQSAIWGALDLALQTAPGAKVFLQVRSGEEGNLLRYWRYTGIGDQKAEVSEEEYGKLRFSEKAGTTYNYSSWTPWSQSYAITGAASMPGFNPEPRRYFQFRLDFLCEEEGSNRIEWLEFRASAPAVSQLVGEVYPFQAPAGQTTAFTYFLKPRLERDEGGFDRLEIEASASQLVSVSGVRINGVESAYVLEALEPRRLTVRLPRRLERLDSDVLVEVDFVAQVLRYGAVFAARVSDSRFPFEVPQQVRPGDAVDEYGGDRVWVETAEGAEAFVRAQVNPATFTPNGDGINDQAGITYDLFEATGQVEVALEVLDLAGRRVRTLHEGREQIGQYQRFWDGRDGAGRLVPPGVYLYYLAVDIERGRTQRLGTVRVVY